jgi:hypothetical protein
MDGWGGLANALSPSTLATVKRYAFSYLILTFIISCSLIQYGIVFVWKDSDCQIGCHLFFLDTTRAFFTHFNI